MGNGYGKSARKRAKKEGNPLPALSKVPRKKKIGKARTQEIERDNIRPVLEQRARSMGKPIKQYEQMNDPTLSGGAGQALELSCTPDTAKTLKAHWSDMTAARVAYFRSIGVAPYAKTAKIEMMPERFEARSDDTGPDMRSQDERDERAAQRWGKWSDRIKAIGLARGASIHAAFYEFAPLVDQGRVTNEGKRFVAAMKEIAKIVK